MPFYGQGTNIANADDVFMSAPAQNDLLKYNNATAKWNNSSPSGFLALATGGGQESVVTANSGTSYSINLAGGNVFSITLTGNVTFTFSGAVNGKACAFSLYLKQDASGNRTVTWPAAVKWSGGAPTLTTTANAVDVLVFETLDGGTTWYGSLVGTNFS